MIGKLLKMPCLAVGTLHVSAGVSTGGCVDYGGRRLCFILLSWTKGLLHWCLFIQMGLLCYRLLNKNKKTLCGAEVVAILFDDCVEILFLIAAPNK